MGDRIANWRAIAHLDGPQAEKARIQLAKIPDLSDYEFGFYRAFGDLSTERPIGMAAGPIPRSAIVAYADEAEMDWTDSAILLRVIRAVDTAYMQAVAKQRGGGGT
ncbi:phage tail assembly chaperone [Sphingobium sp. AP50]|uniref:phage tail assembly chaperone n=1 Tax=Sphingobium sp. AP50 TaxID=1884369 RepID=UPI000B855CCD|nr:hypothetical protein [Sphingobium sp. AP50]